MQSDDDNDNDALTNINNKKTIASPKSKIARSENDNQQNQNNKTNEGNITEEDESQHENETTRSTPSTPHRVRTRGIHNRLSASLCHMSKNQVIQKLRHTTINSTLQITVASGPTWVERSQIVKIIAIENSHRVAKTNNNQLLNLPFEDSTESVITNIKILNEPILNIPIQLQNADIDEDATCIFIDGGARPNPGPSASAILVRSRRDPSDQTNHSTSTQNDSQTFEESSHSCYCQHNASNQAELMSFVAACRYIFKRKAQTKNPHEKFTIVTDS